MTSHKKGKQSMGRDRSTVWHTVWTMTLNIKLTTHELNTQSIPFNTKPRSKMWGAKFHTQLASKSLNCDKLNQGKYYIRYVEI